MPTLIPEDLIDQVEVARLLALTTDQVFRLAAQGRIPRPVLRLTKRVARWRRSDVEALLQQRPQA
jgi:predicted DNA-binding transcriptional regulator AlpA